MEVLANLSDNAIHAILGTEEKEKRIILKVEIPSQDFIRIILKDNGYGITEEKIRSIFAPFVTTKASTEGRGMGLYNCRRIIERHKGKIWAESEGKSKGAAFIIELPIAHEITEEDFKEEVKGKRLF
jgi:signal transduction histidine kinase